MQLLNTLNSNNIRHYEDVKEFLSNEPYNLIVKEDGDLYMVVYSRKTSNLDNELVKQCRGIILEKETNKIVCYTFNMGEIIDDGDVKIELSIDGTQIRLYNYNNEWRCATTRCIDAKKAMWFSQKSFYELFKDADTIDYTKLDKNYCYSFVLCHPENRIVIDYKRPELIHVLTRNLETFEEVDVDIGIRKPPVITGFKNYDEMLKYLNDDSTELIEGFILKDDMNRRYKVYNKKYLMIKELRGNTNDMFYRYLELRYNNLLNNYLLFYPEFKEAFRLYELCLFQLAKKIYNCYLNMYVNNIIVIIPQQFKQVIYKIHGNYLTTHIRTTPRMVLEELDKLQPKHLKYIYNKTYLDQ